LFDDLPQLFRIIIALDEDKGWRLLFFETAIAGEDQAVFAASRADKTVPGQVAAIGYILTQDAEPLSEPAEHSVGGKLYLFGDGIAHPID
jgi:hypothetical protein